MKPIRPKIAVFSITTLLAVPLHADLLHRYKFDETTGTVAADFVGTENGTIGASVTLAQPGQLGTSFKFPAAAGDAASRVILPAAVVPGTEFTISAFYNLTAALGNAGQMHIISGNNGATGRWSLMLYDADTGTGVNPRLSWFHNGGLGLVTFPTAPISNTPGEWVHVGITRDATGLTKLYLNGVGAEVGTSTAALVSTTIGIAERPNLNQYQFNGRIDDVRFYNNALTESEMAALAAEDGDADKDGLPDDWEDQYLKTRDENGDDDHDADGFNNRIEFLAGTDPADLLSFPTGDSDGDQMDDAWEWLNFETLGRDGFGDFDKDGSLDEEEFAATNSLLVTRNPNGSVASSTPLSGSSDPKNSDSQPDSDIDGLPDGYEFTYFGNRDADKDGDFDGDGFSNGEEFLANSNPNRKAGTPLNVHATTRVAVAHNSGIAEYSVTDGVWTFVKPIVEVSGGVIGVTGNADDYLYASTLETPRRIIRVNPASGRITTLATRNMGDAATAGWVASDAQGIEIGPDGKIYFSTAFPGVGVFRLNTDGTGFENFIALTGGTEPDNWDLNNSRDLEWAGNTLYVSARGGYGAVGRPVYAFNSAAAFQNLISGTLTGPQGLAVEEDGLLVTSTNGGTLALSLLDLSGAFPASLSSRSDAATIAGMDVIDLNGDTYTVTYNSGPGGQVLRNSTEPPFATTVVVAALPNLGNDLAIFESSLVADSYDLWAQIYGIDPNGPNGAPTDDFDGDGTSNEAERALDLDPTDANSRFAIATSGSAASGLTLTWPSAEGISFQVRSSTDMLSWPVLEATVVGPAAATTAIWTAPPAAGSSKFYRIEFTP